MARLQTLGFEQQQTSGTVGITEAPGVAMANATIDTSTPRSGAACLSLAGSTTSTLSITTSDQAAAFATAQTYFLRFAFQFSAIPSANTNIVNFIDTGATSRCKLVLDTSGQLNFNAPTNSTLSTSSVLTPGQWYRVEIKLLIPAAGSGTVACRIDGIDLTSDTTVSIGNTALGTIKFSGGPATTILLDDIALNDATGASQTSYPGDGKILLLTPVSDNARGTNWTVGGGGTSNLWDAVNNVPPVGVADASASSTSQIRNATSTTTQNYDANVTTYTTAGIGGSDTITLCQAVGHAGTGAGGQSPAVKAVSNPADSAEVTRSIVVAASSPTGYTVIRGNYVYAPSVTLGTSPVVRAGKRNATTNALDFDMLGLIVEYVPSAGGDATVNATPCAASAGALAPAIQADCTVAATPCAATAAPAVPTASISTPVSAPAAAATAGAPSPSLAADCSISATAAQSTAACPAPVVTAGTTVDATAANATASCPAPSFAADCTISAVVSTATASCGAPAVVIGTVVSAVAAQATASVSAPSVTVGISVAATPAAATAGVTAPSLASDSTITAPPAVAVSSATAPGVNHGASASCRVNATLGAQTRVRVRYDRQTSVQADLVAG